MTHDESDTPVTRFARFINEGKRLVERGSGDAVVAFTRLIEGMKPKYLRLCHHAVDALRALVKDVGGAAPDFDLFDVLGIAGKENRYTDALAWIAARGAVGARISSILVQSAFPDQPPTLGALQRVGREVRTGDGRVDLVLEFENCVVAVEVKIWSFEHDTPGARPQTAAYGDAVQALLRDSARDKPAECILLSPDGRAPASPSAGQLSFAALGAAILRVNGGGPASAEVVLMRLLGLHFIEIGARSLGGRLARILPPPEDPDAGWLRKHLPDLLSLQALISEIPSGGV